MRGLIISLVVVFAVAFLVSRVFGEEDGATGTTTPVAAGTSTTQPAGGTSPGSTEGGGSTTSTPGGSTATTNGLAPLQGVTLETIFNEMRQPTVVTAPAGDDRLFVVQRVGVIRILDASREMLDPAYLDISDRVLAGGIEQGLLGLAFHPDYTEQRQVLRLLHRP